MDLGTWGLFLLGGVVIGGVCYVVLVISEFCSEGKNKRLERLFRECDVRPSYVARRALLRDCRLRERWSIVSGMGLWVIASVFVAPFSNGPRDGLMLVVAMPAYYLAFALGSSLAGLAQIRRATGRVRVTNLRARRLPDYLPGQELATEWALVGVGGFTVLMAAATALGWTSIPIGDDAVLWMFALGAVTMVAAATALVLQRIIVESRSPAMNEDELVVADVLRALVVRDLAAMAGVTVATATWFVLWSAVHPGWLVAVYTPIAVVGLIVLSGRRNRRDRTPVATGLTGFESTRQAA
ncbi:MAG: hypothetical protein QOI06_1675 [Nocardioidaceae bacterium]|jgi:hypothetical protein|nr:hypothetical protein [Nocardioidaceae bacterium]